MSSYSASSLSTSLISYLQSYHKVNIGMNLDYWTSQGVLITVCTASYRNFGKTLDRVPALNQEASETASLNNQWRPTKDSYFQCQRRLNEGTRKTAQLFPLLQHREKRLDDHGIGPRHLDRRSPTSDDRNAQADKSALFRGLGPGQGLSYGT